MFGSFPPSPLVGLRLQSLLGPGSRHCYGIITLNRVGQALRERNLAIRDKIPAMVRGRVPDAPNTDCSLDHHASRCRSAVSGLGFFASAQAGSVHRPGAAGMAETRGDGTAFDGRNCCSTLRRNAQYTRHYPNQVCCSWSLPLYAKPDVSGTCDHAVWVGAVLSVGFDFALLGDSIFRSARDRSSLGRVLFGEAVRRELRAVQALRKSLASDPWA